MARSAPRTQPKAVIVKGKTKRSTGVVAIGNKMQQKRKLTLVQKNDVRLRQAPYIPVIRDSKLDATSLTKSFYKKSKVRANHRKSQATSGQFRARPGANRIYKKKRPASASNSSLVNGSNTGEHTRSTSYRVKLPIPMSTILKAMVVPIQINIEYNPELEGMILVRQTEVELDDQVLLTVDEGLNSSPGPEAEAEAEIPEDASAAVASDTSVTPPETFKQAAEFIRLALNANANNAAGSAGGKSPPDEAQV